MDAPSAHPYHDLMRRIRNAGGAVGLLGLAAAVVVWVLDPTAFFQGYLAAFVFWVSVPLGCLGLLMLHHLVAGRWGFVAQRLLESGALTIGGMALLFVPLFFGLHELYEWTHADVVEESVALQHKKPYLNIPFFIVRTAIYFAVWAALAFLFARWSRRLDETRDVHCAARMRRLGAAGLIVHILLMTFVTTDWVMSIDPEWFSTIYAWKFVVSHTLVAIALVVIALAALRRRGPLREIVETKQLHDWGNLMLAFVVLWTYMVFAQYLVIWSGNVPHDVLWYTEREAGFWFWAGVVMIIFHFAVPFLLLLFRRTKRSGRRLAGLSVVLLLAHALFVAWLIVPSFHEIPPLTYAALVASWVGLGGLVLGSAAWLYARRPPVVQYDPRFSASPAATD